MLFLALQCLASSHQIIKELGAKTALVTILDYPSQNLQIIYFPAMLQWPNESYHVGQHIIRVI